MAPCRWTWWPRSTGVDPDDPDDRRRTVRGQVAVAATPGRVGRCHRLPADPPACPEAVEAVGEADWVVLGPGSWFTSVIPHLLVPRTRPGADRPRRARRGRRSTWPRSRARPTASRRSAHLEVLADARSGAARRRRARRPRRSVADGTRSCAGRGVLGRRLVLSPVAVATARRATTSTATPRRLCAGAFGGEIGSRTGQDAAHGDDGAVKDELSRAHGHQALLPQGGGVGDAALRRRPAPRRRARSSSRPSSTPGRPRAGCARTSPRSSATAPS